jgi:DNA transposition AAA+ family ATPase
MGETIDRALANESADQEQIRLAIREVSAEDRISFNEIARRSGVAGSTFSAWLNDSYKGNTNHISQAARIFLKSRAAQAQVKLVAPKRTDFVMTPSAEAFMSILSQAQYEPDMITLVGEPGVGKSEACREYQRRNSNVWMLTGEPDMKSPYVMLEYLCDLLDVRESSSVRRSRAISRFLRGRNGLIIIDEAQLMSLTALDQLRVYHDNPDVRVGIALVGHPDLKARMSGGGPRAQFAQLDSRFGMHMSRKKPLAGDVAALLDAEGIEGDNERRLLRAVANRPGALRKMHRTLRAARMLARGQDSAEVTAEHITLADAQLSNASIAGGA